MALALGANTVGAAAGVRVWVAGQGSAVCGERRCCRLGIPASPTPPLCVWPLLRSMQAHCCQC